MTKRERAANTCPLCHAATPKGLAHHACPDLRRTARSLSWRNFSW